MSETSISPLDFYELKHVRTIKDNTQAQRIQKKKTLLYQNKEMLEKEYQILNQSCNCSDCGKGSKYFEIIKKQYPFKESRWQKRKRILKRFKAVINAIIFILTYKMEAIKKFRKRMHLLKAVRNLTTLRKPQPIVPAHLQPQPVLLIPQSHQSQRVKTASDFHDPFYPQILSHGKEPRKSQITQYMTKMLKDTNPKLEVYLKPLSIFNRKSFQSSNAKSITQTSFSPHTHSHFQSGLLPQSHFHKDSIKQISKDYYKLNNKDLLKLIDSMKVKHRLIKCKK
ncbi:unnamed protein product (macronuclear) [Paramecium tetraurelia]|uniref:Uncharacterized protein n=1 Tax=Paramecium tetraurelia TaxID=5888 RepID=A0DYE9_PARTE|nr:uncharacterized protein GSPATT00003034001 [Paramecium tetraurelia]CAK88066.1 unnamed protein product [Paramecium tetraurelia]|eukprot:XP_001455463.1 hypothetical protein (macronuclear) [Paramecium tetraurelia strain d4-2]